MTMVRYPAALSGGTTLRKPKWEPNRPGMRTSGRPESEPEIVTASDSAAATEILSESLVVNTNATRSRLTGTVSPGFGPRTLHVTIVHRSSSQGACPAALPDPPPVHRPSSLRPVCRAQASVVKTELLKELGDS